MSEAIDGRTARASAIRENRKAELLRAAGEIFAHKGYHQTRISDVIQRAGVARGTFYLYFESKSALFLELLDQLLVELRATIVGVDTSSEISVEEQLQATVRHILEAVVDNRDLTTIIVREAACVDAETDLRLSAFYERILDYIRASLLEGQRLGLVVKRVDLDIAAMCILGTIRQFMEQVVRSQLGAKHDIDRMALGVLQFNLRGVLAS